MTSVASSCLSEELSFLSEATCVEVGLEGTTQESAWAPLQQAGLPWPASFSAGGQPAQQQGHPDHQEQTHSRAPGNDGTRRAVEAVAQVPVMFRQQMLLEARRKSESLEEGGGDCPPARSPADAGVRMIVVSWVVEVAEEFRLQQETLHLAVLLLDRFMASSEEVPRCVLQLLAIGCILLAAKDLEVSQPTVEQLCAVTANHFLPHDLLRMERIILNTLDFSVSGPSCYTFLHLLAQVCASFVTPSVLSLAMYLCELSMLDAYTLCFSYSSKAAAALLLAQVSLGDPQHTHLMEAAAAACMGGDSLQQLVPCMTALLRLQQVAYQHTLSAVATAASAAAAGPASISTAMSDGAGSAATSPHAYACTADSGLSMAAAAGAGAAQHGCPAPDQPEDLLGPLRVKFGADCWCNVSTMPPLALLPRQA